MFTRVPSRLTAVEPEVAILGADQKERGFWGRECIERTQLNAAHAQLLEKLRPIALEETRRFLTIHSLEFQETLQKIVKKPRELSITKNLNFDIGNF